jgi:hypothetical protein
MICTVASGVVLRMYFLFPGRELDIMNIRHLLAPLLISLLVSGGCILDGDGLGISSSHVYANVVIYSGQGITEDESGYHLNTEICGIENGAPVDGPYLLWVLTATRAGHADITGPWGTSDLTQKGGGAFQYVSGWYDLGTLPGNVSASYDGPATHAQLVISHGCPPANGAWCSPGFWRNATDAAWALTGYSRSDLFNNNVYEYWYGASYAVNPTLSDVLAAPPVYSGPPNPGSSGYALNAFNATGAMLTDAIPGYDFDFDVMQVGSEDACPIDHFGNFK